MKEQNAFETLKNTLEDKYIRRKVVKITQYAFGHKVTLDKPIKVKNNLCLLYTSPSPRDS